MTHKVFIVYTEHDDGDRVNSVLVQGMRQKNIEI